MKLYKRAYNQKGVVIVKAWELKKNVVYVSNGIKYHIGDDGNLHHKQVLERNGCESWLLSRLTFNKIKDMTFEETNLGIYE